MRTFLRPLSWIFLVVTSTVFPALGQSEGSPSGRTKSVNPDSVMRSLMWGDALSEEQLKVAAGEVGMSPERLQQLELRTRVQQLIARYKLPLEVTEFGEGMLEDEEFRLYKSAKTGLGAVRFNSVFWKKHPELAQDPHYLLYVLFRAQAYYAYRSRYDSEHCAWIVENEAEPLNTYFSVLHHTLQEEAAASRPSDPTLLSDRDLEFRHHLDPTDNPRKTLRALIEYALRAIAQKASDNMAIKRYRESIGSLPASVIERVHLRERALAYDFASARFAMTLGERVTFHNILKTPFRYLRRSGEPASEPVYDAAPEPH